MTNSVVNTLRAATWFLVWSGVVGIQADSWSKESELTRATRLHDSVLTIDTHVDTPMRMGMRFDIGDRHDARKRGGRVDLPRMKDGGLDAIFFAVYLGQGPRTDEGNAAAKAKADRLFDTIHEQIKKNNSLAEIALTPDDAYRLQAIGKRAIYIGIENGYAIGHDLSRVESYYRRGARYITLCHTRNNDICDSSTDPDGAEHQGLSAFGEQVVREMNRLGMIVDVSHASDETFYDVLKISQAPIIASHSCVRALCDHPRNLSDKMLQALAEHGGVIQICILGAYVTPAEPNPDRDQALDQLRARYGKYQDLSEERKQEMYTEWEEINRKFPESNATVVDVVNHIDHVVHLVGEDHVGIGTDFDGGGGLNGCYDVSEMGNITFELVKRGYSDEQIAKIWGGNFMRVFREVQRRAEPVEAAAQ